MSFLPLVQRELRVIARRSGTYWIRFAAALLALLFLVPGLFIVAVSGGKNVGQTLFTMMSYYGFVVCLLAGAFLGADCIAEERREGTLGFLFLTDLKGYDIVLGKFLGASLNAFYSLFAILPILGLCLLAGGVTGGEFWRMSLALLDALFFSMALSIFVSARLKSVSQPTMLALGLLFGAWFFGYQVFKLSTVVTSNALSRPLFWLSMTCPGQAFSLATAAGYLYRSGDFWRALVVSNLAGLVMVGLASWRLDHSVDAPNAPVSIRRKGHRSRRLLEVEPIAWLLDDSRSRRLFVWVLAIVGSVVALASAQGSAGILIGWATGGFYFILKLLFAAQACRFFAEGRRTGALELLRTTPLGGRQMISGQWAMLRRIFLWPVCILLGSHLVAVVWTVFFTSSPGFMPFVFGMGSVTFFYAVARHALDFLAIGWMGMWIALVCRQPNRAVWLTILFTVLIPVVLFCVPNVIPDAILILIARDKVLAGLNAYLKSGAANPATIGRWSEAAPQSGKPSA